MALINPNYNDVHNAFRLNGFHLGKDDLCRVAYSFIKEGEEYEKSVGDFLLDWFDDNDTIEMMTSGTTGTPKTIRVNKQSMVNSAVATGEFFELLPGYKALHCLPTKFVAGKMMLVRAFILGLDLDLVAPSSHPLRNNDTKYDFAAMVPLQVQQSLDKLDQVRKLIVGGARLDRKLENALKKRTVTAYETYGMTETITHIAARKVGEAAFTTLPGVSISCDGKKCLVIRAPHIAEDVVATNDLVELVGENQFVFLGRIDNVINSGGIKLIPEMIEEKLSRHIGRRFFVASKPDATLGEKLVLVVEGAPMEIAADSFAELDKYEKPREILFAAEFLETGSGKIKRAETLKTAQ